jgi:hypothetical protein
MRRLLIVAALVFAVAPLWGQMRGGGRGFVSAGRFGFGHQSGFFGGFHRPPVFFRHPGSFGCRGCFGRNRFYFGATFGSYYPYYYGGYYSYGAYPYYPVVVQSPQPTYYSDDYYERGDLRRDIDVLTGKVDQLQQDLQERQSVPRPPAKPTAAPEPQQSTILVFKDKHTREVQNYAIVGNTVWILNELHAEKIPLSELDIDATGKLNDERGVGFQAPH